MGGRGLVVWGDDIACTRWGPASPSCLPWRLVHPERHSLPTRLHKHARPRRFKSLQQRGMIEVQNPRQRKAAKRVTYIRGEKGEREREGHAEIMAARKARKGA